MIVSKSFFLGFIFLSYGLLLCVCETREATFLHLGHQRIVAAFCAMIILFNLLKRRIYSVFAIVVIDFAVFLSIIAVAKLGFGLATKAWDLQRANLSMYLPIAELSTVVSMLTLGGTALILKSRTLKKNTGISSTLYSDAKRVKIRTWIFFVIIACIAIIIAKTNAPLLWSEGYGGNVLNIIPYSTTRFFEGIAPLILGGVIYQSFSYRKSGLKRRKILLTNLFLFITIFLFYIGKGERGFLLGIILVLAVLFYDYFSFTKVKLKTLKFFCILLLASIGVVFLQFMETIRGTGYKNIRGESFGASSTKQRTIGNANLSTAIIHLTGSVYFFHNGNKRYGTTYKNLVMQQIPCVIYSQLGYDRTKLFSEDPEKLKSEGIVHGGGFYVVGQNYWNYGIIGVLLGSAAIGTLLFYFERLRLRGPVYRRWLYFGGLVVIPYGYLYGLQCFLRGVATPIILAFLICVFKSSHKCLPQKS